MSDLPRCPFCNSEAKSDNGFMPLESIVYAYCSNNECPLHNIDGYGFSVEEWNTRPIEDVLRGELQSARNNIEILMELYFAVIECSELDVGGGWYEIPEKQWDKVKAAMNNCIVKLGAQKPQHSEGG